MCRQVRALFFGTPQIAVASLEALREVADVVGVVCQPDRPSGRGMKLQAPPVKQFALKAGIEVYQPAKVRDGRLQKWMAEKHAELALVIAYGRILDESVLSTPVLGCLNLHASLLPKYRGAAPIQHALLNGETETGVCLMQMDVGMDTGDILHEERIGIAKDETTASLTEKISVLAAQVTRQQLPRFQSGGLKPRGQAHELASHAAPILRQDSYLNFSLPAVVLERQVQAFAPKPGATALIGTIDQSSGTPLKRLKLLKTQAWRLSDLHPMKSEAPDPADLPGQVIIQNKRVFVLTGDKSALEVLNAQPEGKKPQDTQQLLNGRILVAGSKLLTP